MTDDISGLLRQNLPEPPLGDDFGPRARGIRRRRQLMAGAAVVALVAVPIGWGVTQIAGRPQVYATPSVTVTQTGDPTGQPTVSPSPTTSPTTSTPAPTTQPPVSPTTPEPTAPTTTPPAQTSPVTQQPTQTFANAGKATFDHFTVELKPIAQEGSGQYPNFQVEVCVVNPADPNPDGTTRVSPNPWKLGMSDGAELTASPSTEFAPAFPAEARLLPGECAGGWLEFRGSDRSAASQKLVYANSVGERAEWTFG